MNSSKYLDKDFHPEGEKNLKARDQVIVVCPYCKKSGGKLLNNLRQQIKKIGEYRCRSCATSLSSNPIKARVLEKLVTCKLNYKPLSDYKVSTILRFNCKTCESPINSNLGNFLKTTFTGDCRACGVSKAKKAKSTVTEQFNDYLIEHGYNERSGPIHTRDSIELSCFDCGLAIKKMVNNLFRDPEKPPLCRSCGGKRSHTGQAVKKKEETMLKRYGAKNPMQVESLRNIAWDTRKKKGLLRASAGERELGEFIKTIYPGPMECNSMSILGNSELDIYLPDLKIAFEFNGLYWHSDRFRSNRAHWNKRVQCENLGIRLIQIYDTEWLLQRNIVESIIRTALGRVHTRVFARKCQIKTIPSGQAQEFLKENHLMGPFKAAVHMGLFYDNELVSLLSYKAYKKGLDISRFCCKRDCIVVGGLSKLLARLPESEFIQSFVDLRYATGSSLETLDFKRVGCTLGWMWTDFKYAYNRLNCRANMDGRKLSEKEHAEELGWSKIYDAGQAKYVKVLRTLP